MPALFEYNNVYGTALAILLKKGYQVWYEENDQIFWAERDGWDFASRSPCGLLGLVAIFEERQPKHYDEYWWRVDEVDFPKGVPTAPLKPYRSIIGTLRKNKKWRDPGDPRDPHGD
jgi:hypothetical protein